MTRFDSAHCEESSAEIAACNACVVAEIQRCKVDLFKQKIQTRAVFLAEKTRGERSGARCADPRTPLSPHMCTHDDNVCKTAWRSTPSVRISFAGGDALLPTVCACTPHIVADRCVCGAWCVIGRGSALPQSASRSAQSFAHRNGMYVFTISIACAAALNGHVSYSSLHARKRRKCCPHRVR